jgi:hypothetical protein
MDPVVRPDLATLKVRGLSKLATYHLALFSRRRTMARSAPKSRKPLQAISQSMHKGGLHESLGVPMGKKIPTERIEQATHSSNPKVRKQANLAQTFAKFRKGGE